MSNSTDEVYKELSRRIVAERKKKGISQEQLASDSGIDRSHIGFIEQSHRRPTVSTRWPAVRLFNEANMRAVYTAIASKLLLRDTLFLTFSNDTSAKLFIDFISRV